jgi:hypothetical protein
MGVEGHPAAVPVLARGHLLRGGRALAATVE